MNTIKVKVCNTSFEILMNSNQLYNSLLSEMKHIIIDNEASEKKCKLMILPPWKIVSDFMRDYCINDTIIINTVGKKDSIETLVTSSLNDNYVFKWFISKYIITTLSKQSHSFSIHASSVKINNKGVLFVGSKDSGKSTLSLASLLWHDAKFISDDITILCQGPSGIYATGLFNGMNINNNEIDTIRTGYIMDEMVSNYKKRLIIKNEYTISESNIDYIVFPKTSTRKSSINKISVEKGIKNIMKNLMFNENDKNIDELLKSDLLNKVRFYEMHLNSSINENIDRLIKIIN